MADELYHQIKNRRDAGGYTVTYTINSGSATYRSTNMGGGTTNSAQSSTTQSGGGIIWTPSNPVSSPTTGSGGTTINGSKSTSLGAGGIILTSSNGTSTPLALSSSVTKTDVQYIIVLTDGSVLEFEEANPLTAKEMIGICRFFAVVAGLSNPTAAGVGIKWSEIINKLGIQRHFKPGSGSSSSYSSSGSTMYIKLIDAK